MAETGTSKIDSKANPLFDRLRGEPVAGPSAEYWFTLRDGIKLFIQSWMPEKPKAIVFMLHGLSGHGQPFAILADGLKPNGIGVICPDYRGHGLSEGIRGDIPSIKGLMDDLSEVLLWIKNSYPGVPIFLTGESMGGAIATNFVLLHQDDFEGLILFSPALKAFLSLNIFNILMMPVYFLLLAVAPGVRLIPTTGEEDKGTRNPLAIEFEKSDKFKLPKLSPRYFWQVRTMMLNAQKTGASNTRLPTLIFQGGADKVVNEQGVREYMEKLAAVDKEFVFYPEGYHCLPSDVEFGPQLKQRVASWIQAHC